VSDQPADIRIEPARPERWSDVRSVLDDAADQGCWCQPWRGTDPDARRLGETRPGMLQRQMRDDEVPPGFLAYIDGLPAGWAGVSVRGRTPRLDRSRTIPAIDDRPVWSIGCFRVVPGCRRRGVARALLAGVVEAARMAGAPGVEACPVDPGGQRMDVGFGFVGIASMFDAAGFRRVTETGAHSGRLPRILVRLDLA
jgi:GNAT superfamily N-acetyltransferase